MTHPINERTGAAVRDARTKAGLSQRDLAKKVNALGWETDSTQISRLETGQRHVRLSQLVVIAEAIPVPLALLIPDVMDRSGDYSDGFRAGALAAARAAMEVTA